jgi:nitrate/nitrite transporter NarK
MSVTNRPDPELREQSFGELLKRISEQTSTLVRQEIELAKAEMTLKAKRAGRGAGFFGGAGILGLAALGALTAFLIVVLDLGMPLWAAALIVTVLWAACAAVLALRGRRELQEAGPPLPEQTIETVKEDVEWAKSRM